ncbi:MAG: aminotransferase class IV [Bdellovibrionales bacterium]|nr:aminotransferase class IV [Bdellovibrionales bacterium]
MTSWKLLAFDEALKNLRESRVAHSLGVRVYYSSWLGGISKDLALMVAPLDDHMVHRGDAVFEALRFHSETPYLWRPHWERLNRSANAIGIEVPMSEEQMRSLVLEMIYHSSLKDGLIRIYLSRGAGGFTVNPYECKEPGLFVVAGDLKLPSEQMRNRGVTLTLVKTPSKEGLFAQVKSCNYLQNVLARKEAIDRGFDFGIMKTAAGEVTESSTENLLIINQNNEVVFPLYNNVLQGTTLNRVKELLEASEKITVLHQSYGEPMLKSAKALMLVGTTLGVLPVGRLDERIFSDFTWANKLSKMLQEDIEKSKNSASNQHK